MNQKIKLLTARLKERFDEPLEFFSIAGIALVSSSFFVVFGGIFSAVEETVDSGSVFRDEPLTILVNMFTALAWLSLIIFAFALAIGAIVWLLDIVETQTNAPDA